MVDEITDHGPILNPIPATVLDPFLGAGTTALVADRLDRDCVGIELNADYAAMAERRVRNEAGMFAAVAIEEEKDAIQVRQPSEAQ